MEKVLVEQVIVVMNQKEGKCRDINGGVNK